MRKQRPLEFRVSCLFFSLVVWLVVEAHTEAVAHIVVSIRFLRSTGGRRLDHNLYYSALWDKRGRKSLGWRKRWHLKVSAAHVRFISCDTF